MRPQYSIIEGPAAEPIAWNDATAHLRTDSYDDVEYVEALVSVAREYVDTVTGRQAVAKTWRLTAESWEDLFAETDVKFASYIDPKYGVGDVIGSPYKIPIYKVPLVSVTSVKYYAPDAATQTTLASSGYRVITAAEPAIIQLVDAPPSVDDRADAIEIEFVSGSTAGEMHKHAIRLMVAHLYENRVPVNVGNSTSELPFGLRDMIQQLKLGGWF